MQTHRTSKSRAIRVASMLIAALLAAAIPNAHAQWKPEKNVEIIVGSAPGGPLDTTARLLEKLATDRGIGVPVTVVHKTGGSQALAVAYLNQHPGDAHYVAMALVNLLTNRILGSSPITYSDVTPLAMLAQEYIGMSVRADAPFKTGKDVIDRLRADPTSLSIAITGRVGAQHLAAGTIAKAAGVDLKKLKFVSFKGGSESSVAVLGGHVDVLVSSPSTAWSHVRGGKLRMLAVTAPRRLPDELAGVPTWKELGIDAVAAIWRAAIGPRGLTAAQVAYWDRMFADIVKSAEWQNALKKYQWDSEYRNSADTLKFMQQEYKALTALIADLGDAK